MPKLQIAELIAASDMPDLMGISEIPRDPNERAGVSALISARLEAILDGRLTSDERTSYNAAGKTHSSRTLKFDELIIELTETLGWRVLLSTIVVERIRQWHDGEKNGPECLKKFGNAMVRSSRIARGEVRHTIRSPEFYQDRKNALQEIRALCQKLSTRPNLCRPDKAISDEIRETPSAYPYLSSTLTSFLRYLNWRDSQEQGFFTKRLVTRQATPGEIVDGWFDWGLATSEGQSRKIISHLGSQKRR